MSSDKTVPSVKILALKVRFGIRNEAKLLPVFLRCFPNVETLHVMVRFYSLSFSYCIMSDCPHCVNNPWLLSILLILYLSAVR